MTTRRRLHLLRALIALGAIACGIAGTAAWIVNRPEALHHALAVASLRSGWKIEVGHFEWRPLESRISLAGISASHEEQGKRLRIEHASLSYKPWGLLRLRLVLNHAAIQGIQLALPGVASPSEPRAPRRMNLAKLILLKHLELQDVSLEDISIHWGEEASLGMAEAHLVLSPAFFGDTSLAANASELAFSRRGEPTASAGKANLQAQTNLSRWTEGFPFLNAIEGKIRASDLSFKHLRADSLAANSSLDDGQLSLSDFRIAVGDKALEGALRADIPKRSFALSASIPAPLHLPFIGRMMETIDTAGSLSGSVELAGTGFSLEEAKGQGRVEISHRFDISAASPVSLEADVAWEKSAIRIPRATVRAGTSSLAAEGSVDIANKRFSIRAEGKQFPIEHLFDKFRNPHLKKIFGPSDVAGTIEGWGRTFKARVRGTTRGGGWRPITAESIDTELEATYDDLKLKGTIVTGGRPTGLASLSIHFGPKVGQANRTKHFELDASVSGHPLESSLASVGLSGSGTGKIRLSGPHTAFRGEAEGRIADGRWRSLPFERASSKLSISRHQLLFSSMALKLPSLNEPRLTGTLAGDIGEGTIRFHGVPLAGLALDATYRIPDGRWQIREASWSDPARPGDRVAMSGAISAAGAELKLSGRVDLSSLATASPRVREASGPVDLDLSLRGTLADPRIGGTLVLHDNTFSPRGARIELEHLTGGLRFEGGRIHFDRVQAKIDDGEASITGSLDHRGLAITSTDLAVAGRAMRYRSEDGTISLELDGALSLAGPISQPLLKGEVTVLDGKYTKDFTLVDAFFGQTAKPPREKGSLLSGFNPRLDLVARNSGDLAIRNNVGDIWLKMDVGIRGTREKPFVSGAIQTAEGRVHYLGIDFEVTRGFIEFLEKERAPYLEVRGEKEVGDANVILNLAGPTDDLALDLSATSPSGPLEKRDVVSLLLFGITDQERTTLQQAGGNLTGSALAGTISGVIGRPIQKAAHLDVFRLEAASGTDSVSRLYMGKRITDRLTVNFATDINTSSAVQTIIGEYQITDNLLLKGAQATDATSTITGSLRFRLH